MNPPALSLDGFLAVSIITFSIIVSLYFARQCILRSRDRTVSTFMADMGLHIAILIHIVQVGFAFAEFAYEKQATDKYNSELEIELAVLTEPFLKRVFTGFILYYVELWCLKISYLSYFFHLRRHFSKQNRYLYNGTIIYTLVGFVALFALTLARCWPIKRNWHLTIDKTQDCPTESSIEVNATLAGINLSNDLLILILGLNIISSLELHSSRYKAALFSAAGLGFLSIVVGAMRFMYAYTALHSTQTTYLQQYHLITGISGLELMFAFAAFCLPSFRVYRAKRRESIVSSQKNRQSRGDMLENYGGSLQVQRNSMRQNAAARSEEVSSVDLNLELARAHATDRWVLETRSGSQLSKHEDALLLPMDRIMIDETIEVMSERAASRVGMPDHVANWMVWDEEEVHVKPPKGNSGVVTRCVSRDGWVPAEVILDVRKKSTSSQNEWLEV